MAKAGEKIGNIFSGPKLPAQRKPITMPDVDQEEVLKKKRQAMANVGRGGRQDTILSDTDYLGG